MSDLISRRAAIDVVSRFRNIDGISVWHNGIKESIRIAIIEDLAKLPSADRPTGKWTNREKCQVDEDAYEVATCSECGAEITIEYPHDNYCPHCGAKMKGNKNV